MDFGMHALEFPMMVAAHALILWPKTDPPWYPLAPHIFSNVFVWFFPFSLQFFSESTRVCFNDLQTLRCSPALQIPAASKTPNIFFRRLFVSPYHFSIPTVSAGRLNNAVRFLAFTDSERLESARKKRADIQVVPTPNRLSHNATMSPKHENRVRKPLVWKYYMNEKKSRKIFSQNSSGQ